MDTLPNDSLPFSKQLELISRAISLLGIGAYFSGLLITHIFLASHGFFLFQLLKVDYIFVGGLWLALLALAYIWSGAIVEQFLGKDHSKWFGAIIICLLFSIMYLFLMALISDFSVDKVTGLSDIHLLYTCGVFIGQAISLHIIVWVYKRWKTSKDKGSGQFSLLAVLTMIVVMIFLSAYYRYALDIYPLYPRIIGGGRPAEAQLVLSQENLGTARALGLEIDAIGRTPPVSLLYETSEAYFILPEDANGYGIRIASSEVSSVIYRKTGSVK